MVDPHIPRRTLLACEGSSERLTWLQRLPDTIREIERRWELGLGDPFEGEGVSWVAPARRADGSSVVLKIGLPHMEAAHEIHGLRFWNGNPTVRLLEADVRLNAMLLERCEPGTSLRSLPEERQDEKIAGLLLRLWRVPERPHPFRPLGDMLDYWRDEALADRDDWTDRALVEDGLRLYREMSAASPEDVLLATDLHAGNVLRAQREPWLVIDPKPFVGDRTYDAAQHLLNCRERLTVDAAGVIRRFSNLLGVDEEGVGRWTFARLAVETRLESDGGRSKGLARHLGRLYSR